MRKPETPRSLTAPYGLGSRSAHDDRHRQLLKLILRGGFMQVVQVRVCDQVLLKLLRHDAREE
jgi:hypothetical protein